MSHLTCLGGARALTTTLAPHELFERGRAANAAGRPAEAERLLKRALDRVTEGGSLEGFPDDGKAAPAVIAQVRVLLALSAAELERRGVVAAVETVHRALQVAREAGATTLAAMCHSQLGMIYGRSGRPTQALRELDRAIRSRTGMEPRDQFVMLISRGMVRMDLSDARGAQADFSAAVALAVEHQMTSREFMARHNLACAVALAGDLPQALKLMIEADQVPTDLPRAVAKLDRARLLLEVGMVAEGTELLAEAADAGREQGQQLVTGEIEVELARALVMLGELERAIDVAERARRAFPADVSAWRRRAELVLLAARCQQEVGLTGVAQRAAQVAQELVADGDRVGWGTAQLVEAEALARQGDWSQAQDRLAAVAEVHRSASLITKLRHQRVAALVALAQGDDARAARELRAAARLLQRASAGTGSVDVRAASSLHADELARLDRSIALRRGAGAVLVSTERWRSISATVPQVRPPADPELEQRISQLRRLRAQQLEEPARSGPLRERVHTLEKEIATRSWASRGPRFAGWATAPSRSVQQARERLAGTGTDLVMYSHDGRRLGAVVVQDGRARHHDLAPLDQVLEAQRRLGADLAACATIAHPSMLDVVRASLDRSVAACQALMLDPLDVGASAVVIPTDRMLALPWGLLRRRLATTVAPSLAVWLRGARQVTAPRVATLAGPGLPLADQENAAVAQIWQNALHPGGIAVGAQLHTSLEQCDLVHIAAHGTHQSESPLLSSVWLGDGPVFLCDLETTRAEASLVVVSACDAGRSHSRGRGEHLGLASGLLALGVSSVIAAIAPVPDQTAAALMPLLHTHLHRGLEVSQALALAAGTLDDPLAGAFVAMGSPWQVG